MPLALACIQPEFVGINQMQQRQLDASGTLEETALAWRAARRLYITGHSLGGGLAKLVAANVSIPVGSPRTQSFIGDNRCIGKSDKHAYTERTWSREKKLFQIATASASRPLRPETVILISKHLYMACGFNPMAGLWILAQLFEKSRSIDYIEYIEYMEYMEYSTYTCCVCVYSIHVEMLPYFTINQISSYINHIFIINDNQS